jgi:phage shock protein C
VCGGLGERFEIDPVLFRVAFILLALVFGLGILLYVVLWLLIPRAPAVPVVNS